MHSSEFRTMNGSYYSCDVNGKNCVEVIDASGVIKGSIQETLAQGSVYVGNSSNVTSELSAKGDGKILVGNGTTITSVSVSGDATLANTGALTIGNDKVTTAKILNANVTLAKLAAGITPSHVIKFVKLGSEITTTTLTGLVVGDTIISILADGTTTVALCAAPDTLPADPADTTYLIVLRAAA